MPYGKPTESAAEKADRIADNASKSKRRKTFRVVAETAENAGYTSGEGESIAAPAPTSEAIAKARSERNK